MQVAYARSVLPRSIFLAGPTPREQSVPSWRPEALRIIDTFGFDGTVFVPEDGDGSTRFSYDDQIEWELRALHSATVILFWIPRELTDMPAFTTNVEFGLFAARRNIVMGHPRAAPKMTYLQGIAKLYGIRCEMTLQDTCWHAIQKTIRPFPTT